jgi:hypothetical protein
VQGCFSSIFLASAFLPRSISSARSSAADRVARAQVRERQPEFDEALIFRMAQRHRNDPRLMQQAPERISGSREMMPNLFRAQTRIDPNEQNSRPARISRNGIGGIAPATPPHAKRLA